jgi:hypothetical protein
VPSALPNKAMQLTPSALSRCVFQMLLRASAQLIAVVRRCYAVGCERCPKGVVCKWEPQVLVPRRARDLRGL